mgnify:FL=1
MPTSIASLRKSLIYTTVTSMIINTASIANISCNISLLLWFYATVVLPVYVIVLASFYVGIYIFFTSPFARLVLSLLIKAVSEEIH